MIGTAVPTGEISRPEPADDGARRPDAKQDDAKVTPTIDINSDDPDGVFLDPDLDATGFRPSER